MTHAFVQSGYTSLCCARSADGRNPCARDRDDPSHFAQYYVYACLVHFERLEGGELVRDWMSFSETAFRSGRDDERAAIACVDKWLANAARYADVRGVRFEVRHRGYQTWMAGWFSHWTFDVGLSDDAYHRSFDDFVMQKEVENERARGDVGHWRGGYFSEPYCLMGAEERWRWCSRPEGTSVIGVGESSDQVPCRCEGCRANGIVRIDH